MTKNNGTGANAKEAGDSRPAPNDLSPEVWYSLFQRTQVPVFVEDISSVRPLLQEALALAGNHDLRSWLDGHPDFVGRFIGAIKILDANEAAVKLNAASSRQELLISLERLVLPETLAAFKDLICVVAADRRYYEGECKYRALDGTEYYTLNRAWVPRSDDPQQLLTIVTVDITDLKLAKQALAESEERYRLLIETARDVIMRHDLAGRITFINQAGLEMLGRSREQVIGLDGAELLSPEGYAAALERRAARLEGDHGVLLYETEFLHKAGHTVPVEVSSTLLPGPRDGSGEPQMLLVARNIEDRRLAQLEQNMSEARLRDAQKLESLGVLAGGIAHDFNNLLVAIMGNAELLQAELNPRGSQKECLDAIMQAGGQAADLCRQMQAYAGSRPASSEVQNLTEVVDAIRPLLQVLVSGSSHIHYELAAELPGVHLDAAQIRQVLMNVVSNAAEAVGPEGGEIMVRTGVGEAPSAGRGRLVGAEACTPGRYVFCEVRDSGHGMAQEVAGRIFEPFFSTRFAGRGLGLSAALGILNGHGGCFRVESEPGLGTVISFWLPVDEGSAPAQKSDAEADGELSCDLQGRTILLVDDNAKVRAVAESFLRRLGCRVLSAADGYDAVCLFGQRHAEIDAIILDYTMPGLDGAGTSRRLRVIRPEVPLLITSGHDEAEIRAKSGDLNMAGFVAKPYNLRQLNTVLAEALNGKS